MRVFFTGGAGHAGRHVIAGLVAEGHEVVNFDLRPLGMPGVPDLIGDVTDPGQVTAALMAQQGIDAVVHFAAIPRPLAAVDGEVFRVNVIGTEVVLQAAVRVGVAKIILASSESIYGMCYADGTMQPERLPLDEETAVTPMDTYGLSKEVNEATARAVQRRTGAEVYCLRMALVVAPEDYARFPADFANPAPRRRGSFAYIDARDLRQVVHLALLAEGLGFQVFNVANAGNCIPVPNAVLLTQFFPGVPLTRALGPQESFLCTRKLQAVLGYRDAHGWRDHLP